MQFLFNIKYFVGFWGAEIWSLVKSFCSSCSQNLVCLWCRQWFLIVENGRINRRWQCCRYNEIAQQHHVGAIQQNRVNASCQREEEKILHKNQKFIFQLSKSLTCIRKCRNEPCNRTDGRRVLSSDDFDELHWFWDDRCWKGARLALNEIKIRLKSKIATAINSQYRMSANSLAKSKRRKVS